MIMFAKEMQKFTLFNHCCVKSFLKRIVGGVKKNGEPACVTPTFTEGLFIIAFFDAHRTQFSQLRMQSYHRRK